MIISGAPDILHKIVEVKKQEVDRLKVVSGRYKHHIPYLRRIDC